MRWGGVGGFGRGGQTRNVEIRVVGRPGWPRASARRGEIVRARARALRVSARDALGGKAARGRRPFYKEPRADTGLYFHSHRIRVHV